MPSLFDEIQSRYGKPAEFVESVKTRLRANGISQGRLARRSGYQEAHVSRWLSGHTIPTMDTMVILDESLELLIRGE